RKAYFQVFLRPGDGARRSLMSTAPVSKNGPSSAAPLAPRGASAFTFRDAALHATWRRSLCILLLAPRPSILTPRRAGKFRNDCGGHAHNLGQAIEQLLPCFA